eukprot:11709-Eustigmatos_ZCMA.PRE.1
MPSIISGTATVATQIHLLMLSAFPRRQHSTISPKLVGDLRQRTAVCRNGGKYVETKRGPA